MELKSVNRGMKIGFVNVRSTALLVVALLVLLISTTSMAVVVRVDTVIGSFDIDMREEAAPNTVTNFLNYVRDRDYDGAFFHRSVPNFIVQTGGFSFIGGEFLEVPEDPPIVNEFNLSNIRGTVAMAKLGNDPDSANSQWFINLTDNSGTPPNGLDFQNDGFTVFGSVTETDMVVADAIGDVEGAIPGVDITVINGSIVPPMSETPFASNFQTLPALNIIPGAPIDFEPDKDLVLITSMREVGADLVASETSLDFGLLNVGSSAAQAITITNRGLEDLTLAVSPVSSPTNGFSVSDNTCAGPIATDGICTITFQFAPQSGGTLTSDFQISSNDTDRPAVIIRLFGEAVVAPVPRISTVPQNTLDFSDVEVGQTGLSDVVITNVGTATLNINSVAISGANAGLFSQTNDCGVMVPEESCTITVTFTPVTNGSVTADLNISSNDPTQPTTTVNLTGNGTGPPDIDVPESRDFGTLAVNDFETFFVDIGNNGDKTLTLESIVLGGNNPDDFIVDDSRCRGVVVPGNVCILRVIFRPQSEGSKSATITVRSNDPDEPVAVVSITGVGQGFIDPIPGIVIRPVNVVFGAISVGDTVDIDIIITNPEGTGDAIIESVDINGLDAEAYRQINDCSVVEPITGSCTITVTFSGITVGNKIASLTIRSNDPVFGVFNVGLNGPVNPTFEPAIAVVGTADFGDVVPGSTVTEELRLSNEGSQDLEINSIVLSGADAQDFALSDDCPGVLEATLPPSACTLTLSFTPPQLGEKSAVITIVSNDPDEGTLVLPVSGMGANDSDGVSDEIEDGHPNKNENGRGDGNGDGIADAFQSNVVSLPDIFGNYVTLVSPAGTRLVDVQAIENPAPITAPRGIGTEVRFDQGFFEYKVKDFVGPITVTLIFPVGTEITNYFKFVPFDPDQPSIWITFDFNGQLGAEFVDNRVILHLEDGLLGDADLEENGTIVDPGGPALIVPLDLSTSSSGSGCSVAARIVPIQESAGWWLVFGLIGWLGAVRRVSSTLTP